MSCLWKRSWFVYFVLLAVFAAGVVGSVVAQTKGPGASMEKPAIFKQRPRVLRSVIDGHTHMLGIQLSDDFWVSYHTRNGRLYKAWSGGFKGKGPVYGGYSGRPESLGAGYVEQEISEMPWRVVRGNQTVKPKKVQFRGYTFENGRIQLNYTLHIGKGQRVDVRETPVYVKKSGRDGLARRIRTSNVPDGVSLELHTGLGRIEDRADVRTNASLEIRSTDGENGFPFGKLKLKRNGMTELKVSYPSVSDVDREPSAGENEKKPEGWTLMKNSDCFTCHSMEKKVTGPSFQAIAEKYNPTGDTVQNLMESIRKGGAGNWGDVRMTPHPDLGDRELRTIVDYVLSLDEEKQGDSSDDDLFLGGGSDSLDFDPSGAARTASGPEQMPGLIAKLYRYQIKNPTVETVNEKIREVRHRKPIKYTAARRIHFKDRSQIGPYKMFFYIEFHGTLEVNRTGTYTFRTVSNDGTQLYVNGKHLIDNGGFHPAVARSASVDLEKGRHDLRLMYFQAGGTASVSLQWKKPGDEQFHVIPASVLSHRKSDVPEVLGMLPEKLRRNIPGDTRPVPGLHPSFDLAPARPEAFQPRVGGMDFLPDGRLVVSTWDPGGHVYLVRGHSTGDPDRMSVKTIARGLNDPMGLTVVDGEIYVIQRSELTKLIDHDGDEVIDEYRTVVDDWDLSTNFHEYAFGLVFQDGDFFATLGQSIQVGGPSVEGQERDRGRVVRIDRETGEVSFPAHGLRMPNGIGAGVDDEIFLSDNQGDWLPASKILHLRRGSFYGAHSVQPSATAGLEGTPPVVWLPQDQIGNSPSQPLRFRGKPFEGQMIHGDVHHGGIKRVFVERVHGTYQGAVFRFTQGLEAGVNRLLWGPDGSLYVGGVGGPGNWSQPGKKKYGLQRMTYNGTSAFEMNAVRAKANGMEIELTEPIDPHTRLRAGDFVLKRWYYEPTTEYGGPKKGLSRLNIQRLHVSGDRKRIFLETSGLREEHVIYVRIKAPFFSEEGRSLWSTETWYTLNEIPDENGFDRPVDRVAPNTLTDAEEEAGWTLLFDGSSLDGWTTYGKEQPGPAWTVSGDTLMLDHQPGGKSTTGGDLVTEETFEDFELRFEWKVKRSGESGVFFRVPDAGSGRDVRDTGPEMQLIDNMHSTEAQKEHHQAGDLLGLKSSNFVAANPGGQWNTARLVVKEGHVEHWLNGYRVVSYKIGSNEWETLLNGTRFQELSSFGTVKSGHIALEDAGDTVWFRNLRIRELR